MTDGNEVDNVNHPPHYRGENGVESIDAIEAALTQEEFKGFLKGNIIKYIFRSTRKGNEKEDLQKSAWYQKRLEILITFLD